MSGAMERARTQVDEALLPDVLFPAARRPRGDVLASLTKSRRTFRPGDAPMERGRSTSLERAPMQVTQRKRVNAAAPAMAKVRPHRKCPGSRGTPTPTPTTPPRAV